MGSGCLFLYWYPNINDLFSKSMNLSCPLSYFHASVLVQSMLGSYCGIWYCIVGFVIETLHQTTTENGLSGSGCSASMGSFRCIMHFELLLVMTFTLDILTSSSTASLLKLGISFDCAHSLNCYNSQFWTCPLRNSFAYSLDEILVRNLFQSIFQLKWNMPTKPYARNTYGASLDYLNSTPLWKSLCLMHILVNVHE